MPFKDNPILILHGIDGVREALANPSWYSLRGMDRWLVKSDWIIELIGEVIAKTGRDFAYNSEVKILAHERLGLPQMTNEEAHREGNPLSALIYNAQCYRDSDRLIAEGFSPLSQAMVDEAFSRKVKIALRNGTLLSARKIGDRVYAFKPRQRKYAVGFSLDTPAKLIVADGASSQ